MKRYAAHLGVDVAQVKIVDERYRWGSCTVKDNINLNWRLIKAPMFVIDYVIIHELAHFIEANHTPPFLEHRPLPNRECRQGKRLAKGKWTAIGRSVVISNNG